MRVLLVCAALCVATPAPILASVASLPPLFVDEDFTPLPFAAGETTFAYAVRHDVFALPKRALEAMHPGDEVPILRREEAQPTILPADKMVPRAPTRAALCRTVAAVAAAHDLPVPFFANLIQQESAFRPYAISPVGAQGIAQFMPATARAYGLHNPFDPVHAISVSAQFLRELLGQFGNLGLAAAAYNAGPGRVMNWVRNRSRLPEETQNYVKSITGRTAIDWARPKKDDEAKLPVHARCPELEIAEARAVGMAMPLVEVALPDPNAKKATKVAGKAGSKAGSKAGEATASAAKGRRMTATIATGKGGGKVTIAGAPAKDAPKNVASTRSASKSASKSASNGKSHARPAARTTAPPSKGVKVADAR
jgi:hypothetical protein